MVKGSAHLGLKAETVTINQYPRESSIAKYESTSNDTINVDGFLQMFNSNPRCRLCQQHIYNTYKCSIPIPDVDNAKNTYGQEKTEFHNFITGAAMTVELAA